MTQPPLTLPDSPDSTSSCIPIAVIGAACRFHNTVTPGDFWRYIADGQILTTHLKEDDLNKAGVPDAVRSDPRFVNVASIVPNAAHFDADFFELPPHIAEVMDPQQRLFLTLSWEALDSAGYADNAKGRSIGVFGSSRIGTYRTWQRTDLYQVGTPQGLQDLIGNDKDYLATRVAYTLGITGPALTVQTACSSSLVAVHMACDSLRNGDCTMALVGGVALSFPQESGYLAHEGMIFSPDGRCRPYDASASGTLLGNGGGLVLLKPLDDAQKDHDPILAVIRGSAVNNDGNVKVGFTAPSIDGQAAVIRDALHLADVEPSSISLVEGHGTATSLGDPIEVEALAQAFVQKSELPRTACALGSVKANIGHCDTAAGIASFLKVVMALQHRQIPPLPEYDTPNPHIDFESSPFYVPQVLLPWERTPTSPRRAGVSSFGIGGTNCHVIVEEAPRLKKQKAQHKSSLGADRPHVLLLSGPGPSAIRQTAARWVMELHDMPDDSFPSFTHMAARRHAMSHCLSIAGRTKDECVDALDALADDTAFPEHGLKHRQLAAPPQIAFIFPDLREWNVSVWCSLYTTHPVFKASFDQVSSQVSYLYPETDLVHSLLEHSDQSPFIHLVHFGAQIALATSWHILHVMPQGAVGSGHGRIAAAVVAGIVTLSEAVHLLLHSCDSVSLTTSTKQKTPEETFSIPSVALLSPDTLEEVTTIPPVTDSKYLAESSSFLASSVALQSKGWNVAISMGSLPWASSPQFLFIPSIHNHTSNDLSLAAALGVAFQAHLGVSAADVVSTTEPPMWIPPRALEEKLFWAPKPASSHNGTTDLPPEWPTVLQTARAYAERTEASLSHADLSWEEAATDTLHTVYACSALRELGTFKTLGAHYTHEDLLRTASIKPQYQQLLHRLVRDLVDAGALQRKETSYTGLAVHSLDEAHTVLDTFRSRGLSHLAAVIERGGRNLSAMLSGQVDPVAVIFPDGSSDDVADMYRHGSRSVFLNQTLAAVVQAYANTKTHALNLMEIGAGTGGTTWDILQALPANRIQNYTFTDIGPVFLKRARVNFKGYPCMAFQPFDMEKTPEEQGFPPSQFDVLIAANVLHNTDDLNALMRRLRRLLRPGGLLVLREITGHKKLFDCVFGPLVPNLSDLESRDGNLFASTVRWREAALRGGFATLESVSTVGDTSAALHEEILVCCAPYSADTPQSQAPVSTHTKPMLTSPSALVQALWYAAEAEGIMALALESITLNLDALPCHIHAYVTPQSITLRHSETGDTIACGTLAKADHSLTTSQFQGKSTIPCPLRIETDAYECMLPSHQGLIHIGRLERRIGRAAYVSEPGSTGQAITADGRIVLAWEGLSNTSPNQAHGALYRSVLEPCSLPKKDLPDYVIAGDVFIAEALRAQGTDPLLLAETCHDCDPLRFLSSALLKLRDFVTRAHETPETSRLVLVTRGALPGSEYDGDLAAWQAACVGFLRSAATEYPHLHLALLDCDMSPASTSVLIDTVARCEKGVFALRDGILSCESLHPLPNRFEKLASGHIKSTVIAGGLSELGIALAERLIQRGAYHIVLIGRTPLSSLLKERLDSFNKPGVTLHTICADIGQQDALRHAIDSGKALPYGADLLIHLAGQVLDTPLAALGDEILTPVLYPKVCGALVLNNLQDILEPRRTIYFSSAATLFGPAGQAAHAGANSFLEGLASYRTAAGYPTQAIAWGMWGEIQAAQRASLHKKAQSDGMVGMSTAHALDLMEAALTFSTPVLAAMAIDWKTYQARFKDQPHFSHLLSTRPQTPHSQPETPSSEATAPPSLETWLCTEISKLLGTDTASLSDDSHLVGLGMDSLMLLDLCHTIRTEQGVKVTVEIIFEHPTISDLIRYIQGVNSEKTTPKKHVPVREVEPAV